MACLWTGQGSNQPAGAPATEGLLGAVTGETVLAGLDQLSGEGGVFLPANALEMAVGFAVVTAIFRARDVDMTDMAADPKE